jgi:hypothetical protein
MEKECTDLPALFPGQWLLFHDPIYGDEESNAGFKRELIGLAKELR